MSDMPKMPEWATAEHCQPFMQVVPFAEVADLHAAWQAYVADKDEELDATIDQRDLLSREVLRLERKLAQLCEQVMGCVPDEIPVMEKAKFPMNHWNAYGHNACRAETLANLQALFGEMK